MHGFFTKVVVDTVDLMLFEVVVDFHIQILCRLQIVTKRFFDDQTLPALALIVEAMCRKASWDHAIQAWWSCEIKQRITLLKLIIVSQCIKAGR
ncbi:Uncharacterised protein [Vibrio cholerae]|uniref:Uncharacterized protein n=1 Tax=Vibrio cholerae TaxID=666 RepID=A0A655NVU6_VIBCL|nr:Uncharacterised protein [Vibrio cholerae]CSB25019.1 Uncharacterised protein [Vibrio cholerae]CSB32084.1 Uncharacterised protein [Vibrio cholerae]CSB52491.1 Uncharacterised protein [Vibrio cholerae]CSB71689.1 Uncharacterised protein [Vibrio cholerae]